MCRVLLRRAQATNQGE